MAVKTKEMFRRWRNAGRQAEKCWPISLSNSSSAIITIRFRKWRICGMVCGMFTRLKAYVTQNGHCQVRPADSKELFNWATQPKTKTKVERLAVSIKRN